MEIIKALNAVMETVGNVTKDQRNQAQGFNFRGIDAVVNAVSPALRKHNVVVVPRLLSSEYETVTVGKNQTQMGHARVQVEYAFYATDGSTVSAIVAAESMDSGDKATAKAMSVAMRTALLQALCLPTDEIDPDATSYERSDKPVVRQASTPAPARPTATKAAPKIVMSPAQMTWVKTQVAAKYPGEEVMIVVGDLIGRTIIDLADVQENEKKILVEKLAGK